MLWAAANIIDRVLLNGKDADSSPAGLITLFGLFHIGATIVVGAYLLANGGTLADGDITLALVANGATYIAAIWLYFHALRSAEVSRVAPWWQMIPALGILGGFLFLRELPTGIQIGGIVLLAIGGFLLTVKAGAGSRKTALLMTTATGLAAMNDIVLAHFGRQTDGAAMLLPDMAGKAIWGLLFLVTHNGRHGLLLGMRSKLPLQSAAAMLAIAADCLVDLGKLYVPVAVVQATAATTPLFVLIGATLLAQRAPHLLTEKLGEAFWKRLGATLLVIAGGVLLAIAT